MKIFTIFVVVLLIAIIEMNGQEPTQTIRGIVLDKNLKTGLAGATVRLTSIEPNKGAVSDKNGNFKIKDVPVGRHEIKVTYLGYKPATMPNILIISGKEMFLNINLEESVIKSQEIVVSSVKDISIATNDLIVTSVTNLRPEAINRYAGSRQDPSRIAATTAGVASDDNRRNDIIVRGNSPLGVLWRVEGVDVPNPNHFTVAGTGGGIFAIINNNLLSNCDFMTGAFPSEYGNKTSATFDVHLRNGNNEKHENTFQLGMNGVELGTEGPINHSNGSSYIASFRFVSLAPLTWMGFNLGANTIPEYLDGNFKFNYPTKSAGLFTFWGIAGRSRANVKNSEDDIDWNVVKRIEDENIISTMYALGAANTHFFDDNTFGKLILSNSASKIDTHNDFIFDDKSSMMSEKYSGLEGQFILNYSLTHKFNANHLIKLGIIYRNIYFNDYFKDWSDQDTAYGIKMNENGNANLIQSFFHWQWHISDEFEVDAGLYSQLFTLNNSYSFEPRFSGSYLLSENQKVNFGFGMHSQTHPLLYYFYRFGGEKNDSYQPNKNLDLTRSIHYVIGYQNQLTENLRLKAEMYYQYLYDIPISRREGQHYYSYANLGAEFSFNPTDSCYNDGKGKNYGLELTLDKNFNDDYYLMVSASLFKSKYTDADNIERSTAFDLGHVINILGGKEFKLDDAGKNMLSVDLKVSHIGGRHIIPIDIEKSKQYGYQVLDKDRAYNDKLKDYFTFDLKIGLNLNFAHTTHNFFLAIDNVFNTENVIKQEWNDYTKSIKYEKQLGLLPYFGYRFNF